MLRVGREARELPAEIERALEHGLDGGEVIGGPRLHPGRIRSRGMLLEGSGEVGRDVHVALVVAVSDANQRGVGMLGRQAVRIRLQVVEQRTHGGVGEGRMGQPFERGDVPSTGNSAFRGHVGGLVPVQHRRRRAQVADFAQPAPQLVKLRVHNHPPWRRRNRFDRIMQPVRTRGRWRATGRRL